MLGCLVDFWGRGAFPSGNRRSPFDPSGAGTDLVGKLYSRILSPRQCVFRCPTDYCHKNVLDGESRTGTVGSYHR